MKNGKIVLLFFCQQLLEADMEIKPIAIIHTPFKEKFGIPRQSGKVATKSTVVFEKEYRNPDSLRGIEGLSNLLLILRMILRKNLVFRDKAGCAICRQKSSLNRNSAIKTQFAGLKILHICGLSGAFLSLTGNSRRLFVHRGLAATSEKAFLQRARLSVPTRWD